MPGDFSAWQLFIAIGAGAGALTAIGVLIRKAWLTARDFFRRVDASARIVTAEMVGNGGGTLLDKVSRIPQLETEVRELAVRVGAVESAIKDAAR